MGGISKYAETVHQDSDMGFFGDYYIFVNSSFDECFILSYNGSMSDDYVLPSEFELNGTMVHKVKIADDVFNKASFNTITIGDNCLYIGKNALSADYWTPVNIVINAPGAYIAEGALNISELDFDNLERVVLAAGMTIDDNAFPDDLFYIGDSCVRGNELAGHEWVNNDGHLYPSDMVGLDFNPEKHNTGISDTAKAVATIAVLIVTAIFVASVVRKG